MKTIALLILVSLGSLSCNKATMPNGSYSGRFIVEYSSNVQEGPFQLEIIDNTFHCSGNLNRIPAGGSGTFSISENEAIFQDENMWTADFDWNLILNGAYNLSQERDTLSLSKEEGNAKYIYKIALKH